MKSGLALLGLAGIASSAPLNVMLFIVDDLRPEVAAKPYDQKYIHSPNIDKLAASGTVFSRAYCQQAICGPTRNSFLSGRRPQRTQSWNFINSFRDVGPDWVAFPEYFKEHNYTTLGTGKTYHPGLPKHNDEPKSWSQDRPYVDDGGTGGSCPRGVVCPVQNANYSLFQDYKNLQAAIADLDYMVTKKDPFFLAYGIHKPHLPWVMPSEFWDLYDLDDIALPKYEAAPEGMPPIAFTYELDGKTEVFAFGEGHPIPYPNGSTAFPHNFTKTLRRGYYAAVSWTDYNIGVMMDELEKRELMPTTIVALIGDHGWQLGEHNIWGKHSNFELGTRVPLIIRTPGKQPGRSHALVESVDLYPTIAKLAGLPFPDDLDGVDLTPIIDDNSKSINDVAFSEYPRCPPDVTKPDGDHSSCVHTDRHNFTVMGYSVRIDGWRYTTWMYWDGDNLVGDFSRPPVGEELYAHKGDDGTDFDMFENVNVVTDPANAKVVKDMKARVVKQWKKN